MRFNRTDNGEGGLIGERNRDFARLGRFGTRILGGSEPRFYWRFRYCRQSSHLVSCKTVRPTRAIAATYMHPQKYAL